MTDIDVPGLVERAAAALDGVTPGPWDLFHTKDRTACSIKASYGCINGLSALFTLAHISVPDEAAVGMTDGSFDPETAAANGRFMAAARQLVPDLMTALQAQARQIADLTDENARLRELLAIDPWSIGWAKWKARAAMKGGDNG